MRTIFVILTSLMLVVSPAYTQDNFTGVARSDQFIMPTQKITGHENPIGVGEIVILNVTPPEKVSHLESITYNWKLLQEGKVRNSGVIVWPDGTRIIWGSGSRPTNFTAILVITYLYVVKDDKGNITNVAVRTTDLLTAEVKVGDNPVPPPGPSPPGPTPPQPEPDFPPGEFGLSKMAYDWAMKVQVAPEKRVALAKAFEQSFRRVAGEIAGRTVSTPTQILENTRRYNQQNYDVNSPEYKAWAAIWNLEFSTKIYNMQNVINSLDKYKTAWEEIADGLSKVK